MSAEFHLSLRRGSKIFRLISRNFLFAFQNNFFSKIWSFDFQLFLKCIKA